ncbi:MAG: hypothetical protein R3F11_14130 [Verrucomicrobiales bacterium]
MNSVICTAAVVASLDTPKSATVLSGNFGSFDEIVSTAGTRYFAERIEVDHDPPDRARRQRFRGAGDGELRFAGAGDFRAGDEQLVLGLAFWIASAFLHRPPLGGARSKLETAGRGELRVVDEAAELDADRRRGRVVGIFQRGGDLPGVFSPGVMVT